MEIELTSEEKEYRESKYPDLSNVIKPGDVLKCTVCKKTVQGTPLGHPLLEVLVCKECHDFCDSEFSSDEDGTDKYCRWCGQGGTLYCCSQCRFAFCQKCVKYNCEEQVLDDIEQDDWKCFKCDVKPLWDMRAYCWAVLKEMKDKAKLKKLKSKSALEHLRQKQLMPKSRPVRRYKATSDSSESDSDSESSSNKHHKKTRQRSKQRQVNGKKYVQSECSDDNSDDDFHDTKPKRSQTRGGKKNNKAKKKSSSDDFEETKVKGKAHNASSSDESDYEEETKPKRPSRKSSKKPQSRQRSTRKQQVEEVVISDSEESDRRHDKSKQKARAKVKHESGSESSDREEATTKKRPTRNVATTSSHAKHSKQEASSDDSNNSKKKNKAKKSSDKSSYKNTSDSYSTGTHTKKHNPKSSSTQKKQSDDESIIDSDGTSKDGGSDLESPGLEWLEGLIQDFSKFATENNEYVSNIKDKYSTNMSEDNIHNVCKVMYKKVKKSLKFLETYKTSVCDDYSKWKEKDQRIKRKRKKAKKKLPGEDETKSTNISSATLDSAADSNSVHKELPDTEQEVTKISKKAKNADSNEDSKMSDDSDHEQNNEVAKSDQEETPSSSKKKVEPKSKATISDHESDSSEGSDTENTKQKEKQNAKTVDFNSNDDENDNREEKMKNKKSKKDKTKKKCTASDQDTDTDTNPVNGDKETNSKSTRSDDESDMEVNDIDSNNKPKKKEKKQKESKVTSQTSEDDAKTYFSGGEDVNNDSNHTAGSSDDEATVACGEAGNSQSESESKTSQDTTVKNSLAALEEEAKKLSSELFYDKLNKTLNTKSTRASLDPFSDNETNSDFEKSTVNCSVTSELNGVQDELNSNEKNAILEADTECEVSPNTSEDLGCRKVPEEKCIETRVSSSEKTDEHDASILQKTTQDFDTSEEKDADSDGKEDSPVKNKYRESIATVGCNSSDSENELDNCELNNISESYSDVDDGTTRNEENKNDKNSLDWSVDEKGQEKESREKRACRKDKENSPIDEDEECKKALLASSSDSDSSYSDKSTPPKAKKSNIKVKVAFDNKERKIGPKSKILGSKGETFRERNLRISKEPKVYISNMDEFSDDVKLNCNCIIPVKQLAGEKVGGRKPRKRKCDHDSDQEIMNLADVDNITKQHKSKRATTSHGDAEKPPKSKQTAKKKRKSESESEKDATAESGEESEPGEQPTINNGKFAEQSKTEDQLAAEAILVSSNSEASEAESDSNEKKKEKKAAKTNVKDKDENDEDKKEKTKKGVLSDSESSDSEKKKKKKRSSWKNDPLLREPLSESNSEDDDAAFQKIQNRQKKLEENSGSDEEVSVKKTRAKKKKACRQVFSDSDAEPEDGDSDKKDKEDKSSSDDDFWDTKKANKRQASSSDESSSSSGGKKKIRKHRRIKRMADSDSDEDDDDVKDSQKSEGTPGKRKNIRKVLKEKDLERSTQNAAQEEKERKQRIADRQKLYNEMYESRQLQEGVTVNELVLDFDPKTKETILEVHKDLVAKLKPHQAQGVKFMWDALFESVERAKKNRGSGCILAHCMGLGKTMQVVVLVHTLLTHPELELGIRTVLVVTPLSTVNNWCSEFSMWLHKIEDGDDVQCYNLSQVRPTERATMLKNWQKRGGVAVMGYDLFRNLSNDMSKRTKKATVDAYQRCLVNPGADLVVCDEGHLLKNEKSKLSESMSRVKTSRRVVLTGTPLQNNLIEYHCMIQFVKPNLLGKRLEFTNRFVNPIKNGQCLDSTPRDVVVMKRRAHVLHKMLEGCVQRFDYTVLTPLLKTKHEYVMKIRLTEVQVQMYSYYLNNLARQAGINKGASLFSDYQNLQRVWTHPLVMQLRAEKDEDKILDDEAEDSAGSLKDFIDDDDSDTESSASSSSAKSSDSDIICEDDDDLPSKGKKRKKKNKDDDVKDKKKYRTRGAVADGAVSETDEKENQDQVSKTEWWSEFVKPEDLDVLANSNKLVVLFSILKECEAIGDKVLVFSQSLLSLDLIEIFLGKVDNANQEGSSTEAFCGLSGSWSKGLDYFRLDGQTPTDHRTMWCKTFNNQNNLRARLFLISTRAGGLGINMVGANRVILFDASWNPSNDVQSIFRVYRFGQKKPCYIYRFLASGTMEEKIYDRQVTKLALSGRVVDEHQIDRHFNAADLEELYSFNPVGQGDERPTMLVPKDRLLAELLKEHADVVESYHEHDSLLENKPEENLTEEERQMAWQDYETEKTNQESRLAQMQAAIQNQKAYMQAQLQAQLQMQQHQATLNLPQNMPEVDMNMRMALSNLAQYYTHNNPSTQNMPGVSGMPKGGMPYDQQQQLNFLRQWQAQQNLMQQPTGLPAALMQMASVRPVVLPRTGTVDIVELSDGEGDHPQQNDANSSATGAEKGKPKLKLRNDLF